MTITQVVLGTPEQLIKSRKPRFQLKGRQAEELAVAEIRGLIGVGPHRRDLLIENLHKVNDYYHGLKESHLVALAKEMNISMAEVYEVASFYHHFEIVSDTEKTPTTTVRVCDGLACELHGAKDLLRDLPEILRLEDLKVIAAPCVGRCEQAPVAVINQNPVAFASLENVSDKVKAQQKNHPLANDLGNFDLLNFIEGEVASRIDAQEVSPSYVGFDNYLAKGGYQLVQQIVEGKLSQEVIIKELESSGLRGLGGAGFPAGRKWRIVKDQIAPKFMAVNIDEGEPGTFKDRTYLERDPHRFLEGMLIAAFVVGIESCYIYLRDEYHGCREILEIEIEKLKLSLPITLPHIELRRGAGAYICGEESAMIESIEGKRGEPRMRPPYIAQVGLFGRPTLEHNFETLYWVRTILEKGAAWFSSYGRHDRKGLRSFSVSGRVNSPGVKIAPAGITIQELIDEYCGGMLDGHTFYGYLPGGASGGILPASLNTIPLDFDTLQAYGCFIGSAAITVISHQDSARQAALNTMRFFEHESCGQCTPCRVGTAKAAQLMESRSWDKELLEDLSTVMVDASICGLGQAAPNPIRCVLKYFPDEVI